MLYFFAIQFPPQVDSDKGKLNSSFCMQMVRQPAQLVMNHRPILINRVICGKLHACSADCVRDVHEFMFMRTLLRSFPTVRVATSQWNDFSNGEIEAWCEATCFDTLCFPNLALGTASCQTPMVIGSIQQCAKFSYLGRSLATRHAGCLISSRINQSISRKNLAITMAAKSVWFAIIVRCCVQI